VISGAGAVIKSWKLFGIDGRQVSLGTAVVGDFTGRGAVEIAVAGPLTEGGGPDGTILHSEVALFTAGTTFNPATAVWRLFNGDPQNGRLARCPSVPPAAARAPVVRQKLHAAAKVR
jgi:hypothetical protein